MAIEVFWKPTEAPSKDINDSSDPYWVIQSLRPFSRVEDEICPWKTNQWKRTNTIYLKTLIEIRKILREILIIPKDRSYFIYK